MEIKKIGEIKAELEVFGAVATKDNHAQIQNFVDTYKVDERGGVQKIVATAEKRMGTPEELGYVLATVADERNGYLAGVDILCDGGSVVGKKFKK